MNGQEGQQEPNPYYGELQAAQQQGDIFDPNQNQNNGQKRKSDGDPPAGGQKAKRNRYVSIACNECKRRKIKCNGENPCQRCGNLSLDCVYVPNCCNNSFKDSDEFRQIQQQLSRMQAEIDALRAALHAQHPGSDVYGAPAPMHHGDGHTSYRNPSPPGRARGGGHPHFQGHTSAQYNFDVASKSLQTMGITEPDAPEEGAGVEIDPALGAPHQHLAPMAKMVTKSMKDPLWSLDKPVAINLCKVYEEEMGLMYPVLDMNRTIAQTISLFDLMEAARGTGLETNELPGTDHMEMIDVNIIKMVIASGLLVELRGKSDQARDLFESCREAFESSLSRSEVEIKQLVLLVVVAEYHFQRDEENQAYRLIGVATRLCLEKGLHDSANLLMQYPDDTQRAWIVKLFWSIYVLDRRWSLGMGRPFALQDRDIDASLPKPNDDHPYLTAMILYSQLASKVWHVTGVMDNHQAAILDLGQMTNVEHEIYRWNQSLSAGLLFDPAVTFDAKSSIPRGQRRLQVILRLRTNQMVMQLYQPILRSATSIHENYSTASKAVDVAKETIRILVDMNATTDIYRTQQVCFNYFLITSLGVIFLAVSHAPVTFAETVRDELNKALEIVQGASQDSYIARRLWKMGCGLDEVAPKHRTASRQMKLTNANDPHSNAAVAMASLAGNPVDEMAAYSSHVPGSMAGSPVNGKQLSHQLGNLFDSVKQEPGTLANQVNRGIHGNEADVSRILGGLF